MTRRIIGRSPRRRARGPGEGQGVAPPGNRTSGAPQIAPRSCVEDRPAAGEIPAASPRERTDRRAGHEKKSVAPDARLPERQRRKRNATPLAPTPHRAEGVNLRRGWYRGDRTGPPPTRPPPRRPSPGRSPRTPSVRAADPGSAPRLGERAADRPRP